MSIPGAANPLLLATAAAGGYQISRSLRFNSSDSAYCGRTFSTPTTQNTFTFAAWIKRAALGTTQHFFGVSTNHSFGFTSGDALNLTFAGGSALTTTALFRDPSAWYHIVWTQSGTSHTLYVNNVSVGTATSTSSVFNTAVAHQIGAANTANYFNGYLADIRFIDGQALTPSSFTEVSATTGQLIPKAYTGSFGTNGFWLKFSDNSAATATTLGKDYSGNSNNWTPNNLSVTAGAGNDSLVDTPTSYGTDTGAGGEVRGNYATWNPLDRGSVTLTNGNLDASAVIDNNVKGTIAVPGSTKIYFEFTVTQRGGGGAQSPIVGICTPDLLDDVNIDGYTSLVWCYSASGQKLGGGSSYASYGNSLAAGDILGVAIDRANGRIWFSKNGTWQNSGTPTNGSDANAAFTNVPTTGTILIVYGNNNSIPGTGVLNAGQRPFAYTAPSGFKALCNTNLPA